MNGLLYSLVFYVILHGFKCIFAYACYKIAVRPEIRFPVILLQQAVPHTVFVRILMSVSLSHLQVPPATPVVASPIKGAGGLLPHSTTSISFKWELVIHNWYASFPVSASPCDSRYFTVFYNRQKLISFIICPCDSRYFTVFYNLFFGY